MTDPEVTQEELNRVQSLLAEIEASLAQDQEETSDPVSMLTTPVNQEPAVYEEAGPMPTEDILNIAVPENTGISIATAHAQLEEEVYGPLETDDYIGQYEVNVDNIEIIDYEPVDEDELVAMTEDELFFINNKEYYLNWWGSEHCMKSIFPRINFEAWMLLVEELESFYGTKYDVQLDYHYGAYNIAIIIYYPSITITNASARSHEITDLFVKVIFHTSRDGKLSYNQLQGDRASVSYAEVNSHYLHSHLPSGAVSGENFYMFCTGDGTLINLISSFCVPIIITDETKMMYISSLMAINKFVEYESIEGGPHKRMANIKLNNNTSSSLMSQSDYDALKRYDVFEYFVSRFKYNFIDNKYVIHNMSVIVDEFIEDINVAFENYSEETKWLFNKMLIVTNAQLEQMIRRLREERPNTVKFIFRGRNVRLTILEPTDAMTMKEKKIKGVNPDFINLLKSDVENILNEKCKFNRGVQAEHQPKYFARGYAENDLYLQ